MDLIDLLWYQENPPAPVTEVRKPRRNKALAYRLETLKWDAFGGQYDDFTEGAAHLPLSNLGDRLSLTDVGRQLIMSSPLVRVAIEEEIHQLDKTGHVEGSEDVAALLRQFDKAAGEKYACCHNLEGYAIGFHMHTDEGGRKNVFTKHQRERCWLRICPKCVKDISARLRLRYAARLAAVELHRPRGFGFKHLVLTMRRGDEGRDLRADLEFIHKATKKLVHHFWPMKESDAPRAGAFATVEIGPQGGNVHVHAIVWGKGVNQSDISAYWEELTGNWNVHISATTKAEAIREGLKYITKLAKSDEGSQFALSVEDLVSLHLAMKGKRRVWAWGALYGMADEEIKAEADVERDAGLCDECHTPMLWARVSELRALLGLSCSVGSTNESNCMARIPSPGAAVLANGPGRANSPP